MDEEVAGPQRVGSIQPSGLPFCAACSFPHSQPEGDSSWHVSHKHSHCNKTVFETQRGAPVHMPWLAAKAPAGRKRSPSVSTRGSSALQRPTSAHVHAPHVLNLCSNSEQHHISLQHRHAGQCLHTAGLTSCATVTRLPSMVHSHCELDMLRRRAVEHARAAMTGIQQSKVQRVCRLPRPP